MVKPIIKNCFQKSRENRDFLKRAWDLKGLEICEIKQNFKKLFKKHFLLYLLVKLVFQRFLFQESNFLFQENTTILRASSFFMGVSIKVIIEKLFQG